MLLYREHAGRLTGVAYSIIGQWQSAEDVVQEGFNRLLGHAPENPGAWLTAVVTHLALDVVRSAHHERTVYVGQWLPEIAAEKSERVDVDLALVRLLQTLPAEDRAVVVLADVVGYKAAEIAGFLGSTPTAVRKRLSRARKVLTRDGSETEAGAYPREVPVELVERLAGYLNDGEMELFVETLSEGAVLWVDSGGRSKAALNPIVGRSRIDRFLRGLFAKYGWPRFRVESHSSGFMMIAESTDMSRWVIFETSGHEGLVTGVQVQQNGAKML